MVENSITASYGGALTSDAILVVREEARITHAEAPSPKCIKLDSGGSSSSSCLRIDAHKAVLWHTSEYFQCKVSCSQVVYTELVPAAPRPPCCAVVVLMSHAQAASFHTYLGQQSAVTGAMIVQMV